MGLSFISPCYAEKSIFRDCLQDFHCTELLLEGPESEDAIIITLLFIMITFWQWECMCVFQEVRQEIDFAAVPKYIYVSVLNFIYIHCHCNFNDV